MPFGAGIGGAGGVDVGAVVGNMEATGVRLVVPQERIFPKLI